MPIKFVTALERDEDGIWIAECPSIPGCVSHQADAFFDDHLAGGSPKVGAVHQPSVDVAEDQGIAEVALEGLVADDGRYGCCVAPKDKGHRQEIFKLAGARRVKMWRVG